MSTKKLIPGMMEPIENDEELEPNYTIFAWMRKALKLKGLALMLFSRIFHDSYDGEHCCYSTTAELADGVGVTRQTVSKIISDLVQSEYIIKNVVQENNSVKKHNHYIVNMTNITKLCESNSHSVYVNFINSYRDIIIKRFPNDKQTVNDCLNKLIESHKEQSQEFLLNNKTLSSLLYYLSTDNTEKLIDLIKRLNEVDILNDNETTLKKPNKIQRKNTLKGSVLKDICTPKTKAKAVSKQESYNNLVEKKKSLNANFVFTKGDNNEELLTVLNDFLETDFGRTCSLKQWEYQLNSLEKHCEVAEFMLESVINSFKCNYRSLSFENNNYPKHYKAKKELIQEYVENIYKSNNQETSDITSTDLYKYLVLYIREVERGKTCTVSQFDAMLDVLYDCCKTVEANVQSVKQSYAGGYKVLAFKDNYNNNNTEAKVEIDMDKKKQHIEDYCAEAYYYLYPEIKTELLNYLYNTDTGKYSSYETFVEVIRGFDYYSDASEIDKVINIKRAIAGNYKEICKEDYSLTKQLKNRCTTYRENSEYANRLRRQDCEHAFFTNPEDERLKDMPKPPLPKTYNVLNRFDPRNRYPEFPFDKYYPESVITN